MLEILKQYIEGDMQITEYTRDGINISHRIEQPVHVEVPQGEVLPNPPSIDQRLKETEEKQALMQSALDDLLLGGML